MKVYGLRVPEGSSVSNFIVPQGNALPPTAQSGSIFYLTRVGFEGLYIYLNNAWKLIDVAGTVSAPSGNFDHLPIVISNPVVGDTLIYNGSVWVNHTTASTLQRKTTLGSYVASITDSYIGVQHSTPCTITLPIGVNDKKFVIKDEKGRATSKTISVRPSGTQTIDYKFQEDITSNYGSLTLIFGDGNWSII